MTIVDARIRRPSGLLADEAGEQCSCSELPGGYYSAVSDEGRDTPRDPQVSALKYRGHPGRAALLDRNPDCTESGSSESRAVWPQFFRGAPGRERPQWTVGPDSVPQPAVMMRESERLPNERCNAIATGVGCGARTGFSESAPAHTSSTS